MLTLILTVCAPVRVLLLIGNTVSEYSYAQTERSVVFKRVLCNDVTWTKEELLIRDTMVSGCVQRPKRLNVVCKSLTGSGFGNVNRTSREYIVNKLSLDETLMLTYAKADSVNRDV